MAEYTYKVNYGSSWELLCRALADAQGGAFHPVDL